MSDIFEQHAFMKYLETNFNGFDNPFFREMAENIISYGLKFENNGADRFVTFVSNIIPEITFMEVAAFTNPEILSDIGKTYREEGIKTYRNA